MSFLQMICLAALQGVTEFLPVSSSGHLILFAKYAGFVDQGISIDIALHFGSLVAVVLYFGREIGQMLCGLLRSKFLPDFSNSGSRLAYLVALASLPVMIVGFLLRNIGMEMFRQPEVIGWTILIYGVILYIADRRPNVSKTTADLGLKDALWIGLAQCLALIPGTSRSGITITMARFLGVSRTEAAKFSMLLSVPTIFAAGLAEAWNLYRADEIDTLTNGTEAAFYSFLASVLVITLMMKWLKTATYLPFVIYRIVLGGFLIGQAFF